ncbi:MAG: peptidylprolyl isomerase [Candidatus Hydrogenedentes bacterium]|nr:peptidylprolyl isomerase [Candidatus Hydrogenedentota bacterium]
MMQVLLIGLFLSCLGVKIDGIIATVDDEVILVSDIREEIAPLLADLKSKGLSQPEIQREIENATREALDRYIERLLLYRKAISLGLQVDEKEIDLKVEKIKKRYGSTEEFNKLLSESGETFSEFRERVKQQLIALSFASQKRKEFEKEITISEADMLKYYNEHPEEFSHPDRSLVRRIFLSASKQPEERELVRKRINEIFESLQKGADFKELAGTVSEGPEAEQNGLIGWVSKGDLVQELEEFIDKASPGEISRPIETEWGFHILKIEDKQNAGVIPYEQAKLIIEPKLKEKYVNERYQKWINELKKDARIRVFL